VTDALIASTRESVGVVGYGARFRAEILQHPNVLQEHARQSRDLADLEQLQGVADANVFSALRSRAQAEALRPAQRSQDTPPYLNPFTGKRLPRG
jgi:hypothetical protein